MRIVCVGGGPAGLFFSIVVKTVLPAAAVTVFERNRPDDTFGWGVVFSDQTLGNIAAADPPTYERIVAGFVHWDEIDVHFRGRTIRAGGQGFAGIARKRLLAILQAHNDYETRVPIGIPGQKSPVFQIQILVSPALLRAVILPELWRASVLSMLALLVAALLAYVSARIAFRPLERIEHSLDQMIAGEAEAPLSWEDREFAAVQSKLSLLGAQVSGAKRDASQLRTAIGGIARGVAHEFKNPLNAIALRLEVLRARVAGDVPEAEGDIDVLAQEVTRLDRLVNTFLDLSRPVTLDRQVLQVSDLLTEMLTLVGPEAERVGVILEWTPVAGVAVSADGDLLRQAFLNVVRNAFDAMPGGGHLRVSVARNGDMCEICVSDTGRGIPVEVRERIFEPYFSTKESGSGIGLALTMRAMQMHGGSIDVDSAPGQGTRFCLRLPALPAELPS